MTTVEGQRYIRLTVRIEPGEADEGGFVALCDELGVASQGETIEEALANVQEAIAEFVAGLYELGDLWVFLSDNRISILDEAPVKSTIEVTPGELVSGLVATVGETVSFV